MLLHCQDQDIWKQGVHSVRIFLGDTKGVDNGMHCLKHSTDVAKENKKLVKDPK